MASAQALPRGRGWPIVRGEPRRGAAGKGERRLSVAVRRLGREWAQAAGRCALLVALALAGCPEAPSLGRGADDRGADPPQDARAPTDTGAAGGTAGQPDAADRDDGTPVPGAEAGPGEDARAPADARASADAREPSSDAAVPEVDAAIRPPGALVLVHGAPVAIPRQTLREGDLRLVGGSRGRAAGTGASDGRYRLRAVWMGFPGAGSGEEAR